MMTASEFHLTPSGLGIYAKNDNGSTRIIVRQEPVSDECTTEELRTNARLFRAATELLAVAEEFDRLSLVIESAARNEHPVNPSACARIVAAIKANRAAIKSAKGES